MSENAASTQDAQHAIAAAAAGAFSGSTTQNSADPQVPSIRAEADAHALRRSEEATILYRETSETQRRTIDTLRGELERIKSLLSLQAKSGNLDASSTNRTIGEEDPHSGNIITYLPPMSQVFQTSSLPINMRPMVYEQRLTDRLALLESDEERFQYMCKYWWSTENQKFLWVNYTRQTQILKVSKRLLFMVGRGEYVPLQYFLQQNEDLRSKTSFDATDSIVISTKEEPKGSIPDFRTWMECFQDYRDLILMLHPFRRAEMECYMAYITKTSSQFSFESVRSFDANFRKSCFTHGVTFDTKHSFRNVIVNSCLRSIVGLFERKNGKRAPSDDLARVCRRFNSGSPCNPNKCKYPHVCSECGGAHAEKNHLEKITAASQ